MKLRDAESTVSEPDNTPEGLTALLEENHRVRSRPWLAPFDRTEHRLRRGDARGRLMFELRAIQRPVLGTMRTER